jgi:uncharacterized membrane protein YcgQ (UPF0703/DUF1980 family)
MAEGSSVQLTGFVSKTGRPFTLSRFYITCCVADAAPIGVRVLPDGKASGLQRDDWLDVTGVLTRGRREWMVKAFRSGMCSRHRIRICRSPAETGGVS